MSFTLIFNLLYILINEYRRVISRNCNVSFSNPLSGNTLEYQLLSLPDQVRNSLVATNLSVMLLSALL